MTVKAHPNIEILENAVFCNRMISELFLNQTSIKNLP